MVGTRKLKPSALKRLKDTYRTSSGILLPQIERHVMRSMAEEESERSTDYMHPSEMSKKEWCGRHDYYRIIGTRIERKNALANPSFRMENVFAEGHTIHQKWQHWLWEMGVLVGKWRCRVCDTEWMDTSPKVCPSCGTVLIGYKEYPLRRAGMRIEGHADGGLTTGDMIEVKSIGIRTLAFDAPRLYQRYLNGEKPEDIWWKIQRPFTSHLKQGQLYLWMAWPKFDQMIYIYESKFHQQTKEFVVQYNPRFIAPLLETARGVSVAVSQGSGPPLRPLWAEGPESKVCHSCEYRSTCWKVEDADQTSDSPQQQRIRIRAAGSVKRKRALGGSA